jgi:uncharacterized protein
MTFLPKIRSITQLGLIAVFFAFPAWALDLQQARNSGAVGEKNDGYVEALASSPEVGALVSEVNSKRRQEYARIAKEKGQPVDIVAKLAAQQIISNLSPGSSYQAADGSWKKR